MIINDYIYSYAHALNMLAIEQSKQLKYKKNALEMMKVMKKNPLFADIIGSHRIKKQVKINAIHKVFQPFETYLVNLICILAIKNKAYLLLRILESLIRMINHDLGVDEGVVYSIAKLSPNQMKQLAVKVAKIKGKPIDLKNKIDHALIAGVKIVVEDEVIDVSLANQIYLLKMELLKGGN